MYQPKVQQFNTVIRIKHRVITTVNGAPDSTYVDASPPIHLCEYKPYYGSEAIHAGQLGIVEGGTITMWYAPDVKRGDRVVLNDDASLIYEITSVENVENRSMYMILKVSRVVS